MTSKRFLAFDIGASNGRALVGQWDGSRLVCENIYHFPNNPVQVGDNTYWDILRLFHEVKQGLLAYVARSGNSVDGIGLDTWGVDFGLLDRDGRLLGNPHHHRDSRFFGVAEKLKSEVGGYDVYQKTGVMIEQVASITQLYALARDRSPALEAADRMLMVPSILNYFLTGELIDEHSNMSNTGLIGYADGKPLLDLLQNMGVSAGVIPSFREPGTPAGELLPAIKKETGFASAPVIACATHDSASAVISVPADPVSNWAFLSCGTWSVLGIETSAPVTSRASYDAGLTTAATADGKFMTRKNLTGLWIVQELRRIWSQAGDALDYQEMVAMAESAPPLTAFVDVDDPRFVHPADMSEAILSYLRETGQPEPADRSVMLRVVLESIAFKYRSVLETIKNVTGARVDVLHIVGGGVNNRLLCQLTADALGIPVVAGPVEATSMGNLLMQMKGSGEIASVDEGRNLLRVSFDVTEYSPWQTDSWADACAKYLGILERR